MLANSGRQFWWMTFNHSEYAEARAGLMDLWLNQTCATSGPCWNYTYADCADTNPCTSDLCDAAHGGCYQEALPDGIACAAGKACKSGVCK